MVGFLDTYKYEGKKLDLMDAWFLYPSNLWRSAQCYEYKRENLTRDTHRPLDFS